MTNISWNHLSYYVYCIFHLKIVWFSFVIFLPFIGKHVFSFLFLYIYNCNIIVTCSSSHNIYNNNKCYTNNIDFKKFKFQILAIQLTYVMMTSCVHSRFNIFCVRFIPVFYSNGKQYLQIKVITYYSLLSLLVNKQPKQLRGNIFCYIFYKHINYKLTTQFPEHWGTIASILMYSFITTVKVKVKSKL